MSGVLRLSRRTAGNASLLATAAAGLLLAPALSAAAASPATSCRPQTVAVVAGTTATLRLDCQARAGRRWRTIVRGRLAGATRTVVQRPRVGTLTVDRRTGVVRYRVPKTAAAGVQTLRFRIRLRSGRRYAGTVRLRISAPRPVAPTPEHHHDPTMTMPMPATPAPGTPGTTDPAPEPPTPEPGDGLPKPLPLAPLSVAAGERGWAPTVQDTCPKAVHDRFAVIGPDGKRYPTWHPPTVTDPATGRECTFGHEHGRDPHGSKIYDWVVSRLAASGSEAYAGLPFGLATEALDVYAAGQPGIATRHEDHVGYKVEYENDVALKDTRGRDLGVRCDYLVRIHQGSHSPDATSNNVHDLLYAARCDDGTQLVLSTIGRFGSAGRYTRSCAPTQEVTTTDNGYPSGTGFRSIPDRGCVETNVLVPAGRTTSTWALYEKWGVEPEIHEGASGGPLVRFEAAFGVFDPSRYATPQATEKSARTLPLCWEVLPSGSRANGTACDRATADGSILSPYAFDDVRSPFAGVARDVYFGDLAVHNPGGRTTWWTDPYGGHAGATPFPGAVRQTIGATDTGDRPALQEQVFGRNRTNAGTGVHAPN